MKYQYRMHITKPTGMKSHEAVKLLGFLRYENLHVYMERSNTKHLQAKTKDKMVVSADLVEKPPKP